MSKRILLFIIFLLTIKCFEVPDRLKDICPEGCKSYFYCDEKEKKCKFKGFFPLYPLELIELFILMISSSLATSCGIGGGIVYSSMILGVEELEPSQAFPISNFLILLCGFVTFISFALDKYQHPKSLFIHYDVATIFAPSMLVGAKFGTILNKILPSTLLLILLCCLVCFTTRKTYYNILKAKAREAKLNEKERFLANNSKDNENNNKSKENHNSSNNKKMTNSIIVQDAFDHGDKIEFSRLSSFEENISNISYKSELNDDEKQKILNEDNYPLNWERINYILFLEFVVIIDQLIEGSSRVPSFLGIKRCSFFYWLTFIIFVIICLYFVKVSINKVYIHIHNKKKVFPEFKSEIIDKIEKNTVFVVTIAIIAGIVSSSLGLGGGMITNPLFASLGMEPKQSSTTSNFLIIVTAIASSFIFILSGQLEIGYSICLGIFCTGAALIGSFYILKYINRTGKSSILLVIMEYFLVISFFITIYKLFTFDLKGYTFFESLFVVNKFC